MDQPELLQHLIDVLERQGIAYMVVGSFASMAYGEPRLTQDIDVVVDLSLAQVPALCRAFPDSDYYVSREAAESAVRDRKQFNVIHPTSGNKIDLLIISDDAWGRTQISRRRRVPILPELEGYCATPEDVILSKMVYYAEGGSEKHLRDITGVRKVIGEEVDFDYVWSWSNRLGLVEIWLAILQRLGLSAPQE